MNIKSLPYFIVWCLLAIIPLNCIHADTLEQVLKTGKLQVGISLYEPWVIQNKQGEFTGFEIDVAKQLAKDLGVTPEFKLVEWKDLIENLENKEIDIIIAGMSITPERALRVNFSSPYDHSGIGLAANIDKTKDIKSVADLDNKSVSVGAVAETVSVSVAKNIFKSADIKIFVSSKEAIEALLNGDISVLVETSPIPRFLQIKHPELIDAPLSRPLVSYKTGMAVRKGEQEFLNYLNAWIVSREAEGWLPAKHNFWFKSLEWESN